MKKLTPLIKKKITKQWHDEFTGLGIYKSMWLLRRVGFFVQGICLDRDSTNSNYLPIFHVHNLVGQKDDVISLTLRTPFRQISNGVPFHITLLQHEKSFSEYVLDFKAQMPLPLEGGISCDEMIKAYENYIANGQYETRYPLSQYFDMLCLFIWCDRIDEAKVFFDDVRDKIDSWPNDVTRYMGERITDFNNLQSYIDNPEVMRATIETTIERLGFAGIPSGELIE
ncbi:hypothetical protein [Photobacterium sp. 1_MG-2023]|uniref:hypothetical protein n=1 Tax=Photobacterium sp. 1_MG-2023 TaxID=3062646 RepID=UPI0026E25C37|nr:hypothetical protein [Photobacterium sp. 1_MG-2023]MDO6705958.1 hypothetical protein [Photobacterium sp. 1_MG-2023]